MSKKPSKSESFEQQLEQLETLIERMEDGEQSLEASLKDFEKGISLINKCQQTLSKAELKVQKLIDQHQDQQELDD